MDGHPSAPDASVPVTSRGLAYGDGLFETIAVRDGRLTFWERHLTRLTRGCERLGFMPPDPLDAEQTVHAAKGCQTECIVKLFAVRASGGRGYRPAIDANAELYAYSSHLPPSDVEAEQDGVDLRILPVRLARTPAVAGLKHLNRLEQVLASATLGDFREGLLLDSHARLVEGTRTNLLIVRDGVLLTPRLCEAGVAGVLRDAILDWASESGTPSKECDLFPFDLTQGDEAMVVNSVLGIWPVRQVVIGPEDHPLVSLKPGPMTRRLQATFGPSCAP